MSSISICVVVLAPFFAGGHGSEKVGGAATPREAFRSLVLAAEKNDPRELMASLNTDSQHLLVGFSALCLIREKGKVRVWGKDELEAILKKYGLDAEGSLGRMDPRRMDEAIARSLKEQGAALKLDCGFVKEASKALRTAKASHLFDIFKFANLRELTVRGATAVGAFTDDDGRDFRIHFSRSRDRWGVDLVPDFPAIHSALGTGLEFRLAIELRHIPAAIDYYDLEYADRPSELKQLTTPNAFGKTLLDKEFLLDPWASDYRYDPSGNRSKAAGLKAQPDLWSERASWIIGNFTDFRKVRR